MRLGTPPAAQKSLPWAQELKQAASSSKNLETHSLQGQDLVGVGHMTNQSDLTPRKSRGACRLKTANM